MLPIVLAAAAGSVPWGELVFFLALLAVSGFLSGSEVAFLTFSPLRRRHHREEGTPGIERVDKLLAHPQRFLITILVGNNLVNIGAAALATRVSLELLGDAGVAVATGVTTLLVLTFSEIVPKTFATQHNERMALAIAPVILFMQRALYPAVWIYERFSLWLLRVSGAKDVGTAERQFRSEEEFRTLLSVGAEEGIIEETEEAMMRSILTFGDTVVREIMIPRPDVVGVPADATLADAREVIERSGRSRVLVYEGSIDGVTGLLHARDVLLAIADGRGDEPVTALARAPVIVPESKRVADLVDELRDAHAHLAVVVDEYGGTAGVITLEDALEEIVGEIFDEYDPRHEPVRRAPDGTAVVDGRLSVRDVNAALGTRVPVDAGYETVAGFVVTTLGRLPREGEHVRAGDVDVTVERVRGPRVVRVRLRVPPDAPRPASA